MSTEQQPESITLTADEFNSIVTSYAWTLAQEINRGIANKEYTDALSNILARITALRDRNVPIQLTAVQTPKQRCYNRNSRYECSSENAIYQCSICKEWYCDACYGYMFVPIRDDVGTVIVCEQCYEDSDKP